MSSTKTFICFSALPPELRFKIWTEALLEPAVWAVTAATNTNQRPFSMTFLGPARPYLAGLACAESRQLMKELYGAPLHGPGRGSKRGGGWVNLDTTVVYLDSLTVSSTLALDSFALPELRRFRHVALERRRFSRLLYKCQHLAAVCPALRTIIVQRTDTNGTALRSPLGTPNPESADFCASVIKYTGPEILHDPWDSRTFRRTLLGDFCDPVPKLHVVSSCCAYTTQQFGSAEGDGAANLEKV
ncbi:uncharacterized protein CTRU02_205799 [Colletotrichum truncatum]|uniref:Uncharacterized protein n=1 Tax=Colletotrichum truncatum TaxID=5467 RepID=A0ACC3Z543_COLTU